MVNTFHKDHSEKPKATSAPLDSAPPMAKPTIQLLAKRKREQPIGRVKKCTKWDDKEKATRKRQQEEIRVSAVLEPEAGKRPEIYLPGAGSIGEPEVAVWLLAIRLLNNYTIPYTDQVPYHPSPLLFKSLIIQVPYHPSPSSTKLRPSSLHHSWFFFPCP